MSQLEEVREQGYKLNLEYKSVQNELDEVEQKIADVESQLTIGKQ